MKSALQVLKEAYHLLDDRSRWTTYAAGRDANGDEIFACNARAVAWCASGALWKAKGPDVGAMKEWYLLAEAIKPGGDLMEIVWTNNGPDGYELIRAAFRKAIADLEPKVKKPKRELATV